MKYKKRLYLQQQSKWRCRYVYWKNGMSTKDAIKEVAKQRGLNKNSIYQEYHSK